MKTIYAEAVLLENLLWDYLLLRGVALVRALPVHRGRCMLGAALGSCFALLCLLPRSAWLCSPLPILAVSGLMCTLSYGGERELFRSWGSFLALSAAFGGSVLLWSRLSGEGWSFRARLLGFVSLAGLLGFCLRRIEERRRSPTVVCRVVLEGRTAEFTALRDTGNRLWDPLSGKRVLIAEEALLSPLFSPPLPPMSAAERLLYLGRGSLRGRCRLLSCSSLGGRSLLLCIRPDRASIDGEETELLVGIFEGSLGEFGALW